MRIWSLHPRYLDRQGLTAAWREALLAQKVMAGGTRGYRNHPQLIRFGTPAPTVVPRPDAGAPSDAGALVDVVALADPGALVVAYLHGLADEATARGYRFDRGRIMGDASEVEPLQVTDGQLMFEWRHLLRKLEVRSPEVHARWYRVPQPEPHPVFVVVPGPVADWEIE